MIFKGLDYNTHKPIKVEVKNNIISSIIADEACFDYDCFIAPGLIDLQLNGFNGIDLNTEGFTSLDIKRLTHFLFEKGVTTFLPTVITNSNEAIHTLLKRIVHACKIYPEVNASIGGIHLEGPFLSKADGPRGAHDIQYIQAPNWELFSQWQNTANGKIKIITISPEWPEAIHFIKQCVASGVIVSIGHTSATPEQINNAIQAGATMSTHLGNGSHAMLPRHQNYIFEQLASEVLWTTVIADGFHIPDALLKIFIKTKPFKTILISDATSFAGLPSGSYTAHIGGEVFLNKNGKLHLKDKPNLLAGSAQSLLWGVNQLVKKNIVSLQESWDMGSVKPSELINTTNSNGLKVGHQADLVLFKFNNDVIEIVQTVKSGTVVYSK
ncbi:amidohydrolase family protein [Formosa sediminum]|uniref:Amidohydrolase family protein n=1 Tax=Formosa sediminum TaxID=2594004 RepID=A0A516GUI8_9FLAO|nr:amidohydrolase family protein [Formosa sediminum]QDO95181.1 amidohydrolase family protein [Formosa sediminum]